MSHNHNHNKKRSRDEYEDDIIDLDDLDDLLMNGCTQKDYDADECEEEVVIEQPPSDELSNPSASSSTDEFEISSSSSP